MEDEESVAIGIPLSVVKLVVMYRRFATLMLQLDDWRPSWPYRWQQRRWQNKAMNEDLPGYVDGCRCLPCLPN